MPDFPVIVEGVRNIEKLPGLTDLPGVELRVVKGPEALASALDGAEVLFGFGFRDRAIEQAWDHASNLRWIQWCAAGVDSLLFPRLVESDVLVTNAAGVFDEPIAEHVAGILLAVSKDFPRSWSAQRAARWEFFEGRRLAGTNAVIVGAGRIGRAIARKLGRLDVDLTLFGTTSRRDVEFGRIEEWSPDHPALGGADWLIAVLPNTPDTEGMLAMPTWEALPTSAWFVNVGRGDSVVEADLQAALRRDQLAGAALDVFQGEPLDEDSPWWTTPNVLITPHNSGDVGDSNARLVQLFAENLARYRAGADLLHLVDKQRGY